MSTNPGQKSLEQHLRDAAARAEDELKRVVRYLDDEVVPEVRRNSSTALRAAATRLQKLAESMDDAARRSTSTTPPPPGPDTGKQP